MHINELRIDPTFINYAIKVNEFKRGPLRLIGQYWFPINTQKVLFDSLKLILFNTFE